MGAMFGKFELLKVIGRGGMARVYQATTPSTDGTHPLTVALKRLNPEHVNSASLVDMFTTEADIGMMLRHRNIVRMYESGLVAGEPYIAMECLDGLNLKELLERRRASEVPIPAAVAVHIASEVLRALDYVHGARTIAREPLGMFHRDVSPSNIFLTTTGEVKLLDFGVAKVGLLAHTHTPLELHGKVPYLPPEVLAGTPESVAIDLWGAAACLYEMVTLTPPYGFVSESEVLLRPHRKVAPAHELMPNVDRSLSAELHRALHLHPAKRFPSALEFWRILRGIRTSSKLRVDSTALGRLVAEAGNKRTQTHRELAEQGRVDAHFDRPDAVLSFEQTMTQRIQLVQRRDSRRAWGRGIAATTALLVACVLFVGARLMVRRFADDRVLRLENRAVVKSPETGLNMPESTIPVRAQELAPGDLDDQLTRARSDYHLGRYQSAREQLDSLLERQPDEPRVLLLNAYLTWKVGHPTDAHAAFSDVVAAAPDSIQAREAKAILDAWGKRKQSE